MLNGIGETMWLLEPSRLVDLHRLARQMDWPTAEQIEIAARAASSKPRQVAGKIGILPIRGLIEHRMSAWGFLFGSCSTEACEGVLADYLASPDIEAIVLDVDSPGGVSYGVEELADMLYEARSVKPVYAIANSLAASAAYWIASSAQFLYSTPGGDSGSVGVFIVHADFSKALEEAGIAVSILRAGRHKAEANPYQPLSDDARDHLQEMVDETYGKFIRAVARNRGVKPQTVRQDYGEGRVLSADQALAAGMIDRIMTWGQLMEKLGNGGLVLPRDRDRMQMLRLRHEQRKRAISI